MLRPGPEGVYAIGTGRVGAAETFLVLGLLYLSLMLVAAWSYRIPAEGWQPSGWNPINAIRSQPKMISARDVHIDEALKTPQFYLLWIVLCFNVTAGIGVLGVAKTMITEIFGTTLPTTVNATYAATYVLMISLFNMIGRFFWASISDYIGRKTTYNIFFVLGIILYLSIPYTAYRVSVSPSMVWLVCFYAVTLVIFTMYGGGFATIPAYLADLFGTRFVGGIHGRLLTAWSSAGVLGPLAITSLRENSLQNAIEQLSRQVKPGDFAVKFGAPIDQLQLLVAQKTVTLPKLMEIVPAGTTNPTSTLYNSTMLLMSCLLGLALLANLIVRPVDPKHYLAE
jgi:MFS family permease